MQPARCFPAKCWHAEDCNRTPTEAPVCPLRAGFLSLSPCLCPKWIDQGVSQILPVSAGIVHPHVLPKSILTLLHTLQDTGTQIRTILLACIPKISQIDG